MKQKHFLYLLASIFCFIFALWPLGAHAEVVETSEYVLYVPSGFSQEVEHPLVIAFSPGADAWSMIRTWQKVAEDHEWIILASKKFRNGIDTSLIFHELNETIKQKRLGLPIDQKRIVATGLSGGGMGAHMFVFEYPELISAVVVNTGMIAAEYYYPLKNKYPKGKLAVFLASPADFRYDEMQGDNRFLQSLGWRTHWIEFEGGHQLAPGFVYDQVAEWIKSQW